jgi:AraC family transcriptional regulator, alkane utilization regulator
MTGLNWLLESIRVKVDTAERRELLLPWEIHANPGTAAFYIVVHGCCSIESEEMRDVVILRAGDVALIFDRRRRYFLRNSPDGVLAGALQPTEGTHGWERTSSHTHGTQLPTTLVWADFKWHESVLEPLLDALPPVIHIKGENGRPASGLKDPAQLIVEESTSRKPGAQAIINHLCHILVVRVFRTHLSALPPGADRWLAAVSDVQIGPALALIHTRPEISWTVASLARNRGMSRSAFALKFASLVGQPPRRYLTDRRMHRARDLLRETRLSLKEISDLVGYRSEAALSNAFKKHMGVAPGHFRTSCQRLGEAAADKSAQSVPSGPDRGSAPVSGLNPAR